VNSLPAIAIEAPTKGMMPIARILSKLTLNVAAIIRNGITLTGIASSFQFIACLTHGWKYKPNIKLIIRKMKTIFLVGTAGSGKSLLASKILDYYSRNGAFVGMLNLDPGVENLPYTCDIDVRDYVDIVGIMKQYDLGPNGSMIMANDLIASKIDDLQKEVDNVNPDYLIVDTPGQIELFAYRAGGPFLIQNLNVEEKASIFLHDGSLITSPTNFVSIALLATSVKLRLGLSQINVLTKTDLIEDKIKDILKWSTNMASLEDALAKNADGENYALATNILRSLNLGGFAQGIIPISNVTGEGMVNLQAALSRVLNLGEEVED
jgi:GTPase SAR1 family protein